MDQWDMKVEWLATDQLQPNPSNPNEQDEATFNALVDSVLQEGWTQPIQAVLIGQTDDGRDLYEIVAGEHRWEAGKVLETKVPVIPLDPDKFDQDRRDWNLVKDNILRGKLNPDKFTQLYARLAKSWDGEVLKALMGFTSEEAFQKVYKDVKRALPKDLQDALDGVKDEIRTVDDLSLVLNRLFAAHGETLPSNFMVFSWGGKKVAWIRCNDEAWEAVEAMTDRAETEGLSADVLFAEAWAALLTEQVAA